MSYTTRAPRPGEQNGRDYHFVDDARVPRDARRAASSSRAPRSTATTTAPRKQVIARRARRAATTCCSRSTGRARSRCASCYPDCVGIFILPPSLEELERRLRAPRPGRRGRRSSAGWPTRATKLTHAGEFEYVIINKDFDVDLRHAGELGAQIASRNESSGRPHGTHHRRRLPEAHSQPLPADARRDLPRAPAQRRRAARWSSRTATSPP